MTWEMRVCKPQGFVVFLAIVASALLSTGTVGARDSADPPAKADAGITGRLARMLDLAQALIVPVDFHARVVDQTGRPVPDVRVEFLVAGVAEFARGSGRVVERSDEYGRIHLTARGQDIGILSVTHPELAQVYFGSAALRRRDVVLEGVSPYGEKFSWPHYRDEKNPYLIRVWRSSNFESLQLGRGYFKPTPSGAPYERDGISVRCQRDTPIPGVQDSEQTGNWSVEFSVPNGGFQETDDLYLFEAPESGYQTSLTVSMTKGDPLYSAAPKGARNYYFTANGKKTFGSLVLTFSPYQYEDICLVQYFIVANHNGSRNLAVPPN
jgi:hypothetical protein